MKDASTFVFRVKDEPSLKHAQPQGVDDQTKKTTNRKRHIDHVNEALSPPIMFSKVGGKITSYKAIAIGGTLQVEELLQQVK